MNRIRLAVGIAILAVGAAACSGGAATSSPSATTAEASPSAGAASAAASSGAAAPVTITILSNFTSDVDRGKVLGQLIAAFNQQHAGQITVVSAAEPDWPTLQQKIKSLIAAGTPPDLFLYNYNANDLSREKSGQLMDWTPFLNASPDWKARFSQANLDAVTVNGQIVGIPSDQAPALFYYHKSLFQKAGITSFPTTWDEFFAAADKLKAAGIPAVALMTADDAWHTSNLFTYLAASIGGPNVFAPGANLDTPQIVEAATRLQKFFAYSTKDAVGANYSVSSENFLSGRAATIADGPWLVSAIQKLPNPCDIAVAAGPSDTSGALPAGFVVTDSVNYWAAGKSASQAKADAVAAWMQFFTSDQNAKTMSVQGAFPLAVKTTLSEADVAGANCQMASVLKLSNAAPAKVVSVVRNLKTDAQAKLPALLEGLALGQTTPQDFATQLQKANQ